MATARSTTDHDEIRRWVEARGGRPARVKATGKRGDPGILRIDFPGFSGEDSLEEIEWDEFFEWFDRNKLAALLSTARNNRFNKLVDRTTVTSSAKRSSAKKTTTKRTARTGGAAGSQPAGGTRKSSARKSSKTGGLRARRSTGTTTKRSAGAKSSGAKKSAKKSAKKATTKRSAGAKKATAKRSASTKKTGTARKAVAAVKRALTSTKKPARKSSGSSVTTTNRDEIRQWVEARGGFPAHVKRTGRRGGDPGVLRIDYPGFSGKETLERMEWDEWFDAFDRNKLAFLYQDKKNSRFSKLVER